MGKVVKAGAPIIAKGIIKSKIGQDDAEELFNLTSENEATVADLAGKVTEQMLSVFQKEDEAFAQFKTALRDTLDFLEEKTDYKLPLIIFVDELDRCRPIFAIKTLERIKHIFEIPQIKFVVATDTEQLSHSVKAIYGEGFDGRSYLKRFFSQEFYLPEPNNTDFATSLFRDFHTTNDLFDYQIIPTVNNPQNLQSTGAFITCPDDTPNRQLIIIFATYSYYFNIDLRTQKQCYDRWEAIVSSAHENEVLHSAFYLYLIILKAKNEKAYLKTLSKPNNANAFSDSNNLISDRKPCQFAVQNTNHTSNSPTTMLSPTNLIQGYFKIFSKSTQEMFSMYNNADNSIYPRIAHSVSENYTWIRNYKDRINIVGGLT